MGSSEFVNKLVSDTNLCRVAQLDRGITMLYKKFKKFTWGAHCTCWARVQNLYLLLFFPGCRPNQSTDTTQTLWADSHHWRKNPLGVPSDKRHRQHVPKMENFLNIGSSKFMNFWAGNTKLGAYAHLDWGTMTLYKKNTWGAHRTCWTGAQNLHLFFIFFQDVGQANGRTWLKLRKPTALVGGHVSLW